MLAQVHRPGGVCSRSSNSRSEEHCLRRVSPLRATATHRSAVRHCTPLVTCVQKDAGTNEDSAADSAASRRALVLSSLATTCSLGLYGSAVPQAQAEEVELEKYKNDLGFSMLVPSEWESGEADFGSSGQKKLFAFYDPANPDLNANVTVSYVSPNYTKMGSFGSDYEFGFRLVGSLDRSYADPQDLKAELIDTADKRGVYQVDYTLDLPGEYSRHLLQAVTIGFDGVYNRLYTLTLTCNSEDWKENKKLLKCVS